MRDYLQKQHERVEWLLGGFVVVSSVAVWATTRELDELTVYDIFPPLGLIAFGLMWTHFVMAALRRFADIPKREGSPYMVTSMGLVLALIILHPGLLWLGLYGDGFGLPPLSHVMAYESQLFAVALGTISLMIFLAYELKRWFGKKQWWRLVEYLQIVGMAAIFYHAIELGGELRVDWYQLVWWFYGVTLLGAVVYSLIYSNRKENGV